jgi:hypothetical protein
MIRKTLTVIAVVTSALCFAQEVDDILDDGIMSEIVANKNTCVVGSSEDRIYLDHNRIFPTEQGLYLNLNDVDYILLPALNSDSNGCYLPVRSPVNILNDCPGCGRKYFVTCKNPDCPLVRRQQERDSEKSRKKEEEREAKREKKKK